MGTKTGIDWTNFFGPGSGATWNPIIAIHKETGARGYACVRVSPLCVNCYAATLNKKGIYGRFGTGLDYTLPNLDKVEIKLSDKGQTAWDWPLRRQKPTGIFLASMTDWLGEFLPFHMQFDLQRVMNQAQRHIFLTLTKRFNALWVHLSTFPEDFGWVESPHIFYGVSIGTQKEANEALPILQGIRNRFPHINLWVSYEPALEDVDWSGYEDIWDWLVAGGESGEGFRPTDPDAIRHARDWCVKNSVPFFFKQWGGIRPKSNGWILDGQEWHQFPTISRRGV